MKHPPLVIPSLFIALAASACQSVSIADQGNLSKTAMSFDSTGARSADCSLTAQVERGRSLTHAASAGGCASCH